MALGAPSKKAKRVVTENEFDLARLSRMLRQPLDGRHAVTSWSLADIAAARDAQMRGDFRQPARMAEAMRTDDALHVAYTNRLAPQRCIDRELVPAKTGKGPAIAAEAEALFGANGLALQPATLADIEGCLVNHGVAFAVCEATPRADGSRVDVRVNYWPIEYVRWDTTLRCFMTRVDTASTDTAAESAASVAPRAGEVPIVHGDGRWLIFQKHEVDPFRQDAALLAACFVWARGAFAKRDWAKGSAAHGNAKMIGELPEGVPLEQDDGETLSAEAAAFIALLQAMASEDTPVGIRPSGAKTEFVTNNSTAWQVWKELVLNAETAAARIYLGTDGTLGSNGGAPGVDITALFGVALTKVRGDLDCISRGIDTAIEVWTAINFGDSTLAPKHHYRVPDEDAEQLADETSKRNQAFFNDVKAARDNGFEVVEAWVQALAKKYGVEAPALKVAAPVSDPAAPVSAPQ